MRLSIMILILSVSTGSILSAEEAFENLIDRNNDFAFSFFSKISEKEKENVFISPFSISTALAMTYEGARWTTAWEMGRVMRFNKSREHSHKEFTELLGFYRNLKHNFLSIANAAVAQEKYEFLPSYFESLEAYNALLKSADFYNDENREKARKMINQWAYDNTNGKIEELLNQTALNALTRLVLLNAIHFKADWQIPFPVENTVTLPFHSPGTKTEAEFMHVREKFSYYQNEDVQMIELNYLDSIASMFIILPSHEIDFNEFLSNFGRDYFYDAIDNSQEVTVELSLPKFKLDTEYELKEYFIEMGMIRAFNVNANFSGMTGKRDLLIDEVIHKAFIEIDEKGTEAAAATAVIMREKSAPRPIGMNVNRPFVFLIRENVKGSILFIGKITNPNN